MNDQFWSASLCDDDNELSLDIYLIYLFLLMKINLISILRMKDLADTYILTYIITLYKFRISLHKL